jgi:ectoine hydroxylase-related dioxygenase (phytanoyl-CoA dioxygenase family)
MRLPLESDGFAVANKVLSPAQVIELRETASVQSSRHRAGARNLLCDSPSVLALAESSQIQALVALVIGDGAFPVRALWFDKSPEVNWKVPWHQDTAIAVAERVDTPGYSGWSVKDGVPHVHPPAEVLEHMVTLRIHLDDCGPDNGPLRVLPGSHRHGKLSDEEINHLRRTVTEVACCCAAGDVFVMKPLLLHASSLATSPSHRRVIHIEFTNIRLPAGLRWFVEQGEIASVH